MPVTNANVCVRDGQSALVVFDEKGNTAVVTREHGQLLVSAWQPAKNELVNKPISIPVWMQQQILGMAALSESLNEHPQAEEIKKELSGV